MLFSTGLTFLTSFQFTFVSSSPWGENSAQYKAFILVVVFFGGCFFFGLVFFKYLYTMPRLYIMKGNTGRAWEEGSRMIISGMCFVFNVHH